MDEYLHDSPLITALHSLLPRGLGSLTKGIARALEKQDLSQALSAANAQYAEKGPKDKVAALTYAILLTHRELHEEARNVLRKALEFNAHDMALQIAQADAMLVAGEYEAAVDLMEALMSIGFREPTYWTYLGDVFLDIAEDEKARHCYRKAVENDAEDPQVMVRLAQLELDTGDIERAARAYELAGRLAPSDVDIWASVGDSRLSLGQYERAAQAYRRVTNLTPDDTRAWKYMGICLWEAGQLDEALAAFQKARNLDPLEPEYLLQIGQVQLERGHPEEARQAFQGLLEERPDSPQAVNGMTAAAYELGDLRLAERFARRAVELEPENPDAHYNLGVVLQTLHRHQEAAESLQKAVSIDPDDGRFEAALALSLLATGDKETALEKMLEAITKPDVEPSVLFDFTNSLFRHGTTDDILAFIEQVHTLDPSWAATAPVFEFLARAIRRESNLEPIVRRFVKTVRSEAQVVPVLWDFEGLSRLAAGLTDPHAIVFETMIDILEGRQDAGALEPEAA